MRWPATGTGNGAQSWRGWQERVARVALATSLPARDRAVNLRFVLPLSVLLASAAPATAADLPATTDPEIAGLVRAVSPARLETTIRTLAGFGTRHSLSATDDPKRGIGAARRWIKSTLDACAAAPGARLKVEFDEFVQEPSPRVPKPATLVNVVATLEGVDPLAKARTLVVSGHYDSMCGNVMNSGVRRAGRQRRRVGYRRRDGARVRVRQEPLSRHAGVHGRGRRGTGTARRRALGQDCARPRRERRGDDHQRHRRQRARRNRPPRRDDIAPVRGRRSRRQAGQRRVAAAAGHRRRERFRGARAGAHDPRRRTALRARR